MDHRQLEERIIVLLAHEMGEPVESVRADFLARGPEWACDSLTNLEVLLQLEEELNFRSPHDEVTAAALKSVKGLARHIFDCLEEQQQLRGRGA